MGSLTPTSSGRVITFAVCILLTAMPVVFDPWLYDDFTLAKQALLIVVALGVVLPTMLISGFSFPRNPVLLAPFLGLLGWVVVVHLAGEDPRGGLLGVYQYRQGLLSWLGYLILFLAGIAVARNGVTLERLAFFAGLGLAVVTLYSAIQGLGADPFTWWQDTERSISTIGNANELAAYAIVSLVFAGVLPRGNPRLGTAVTLITTAAVAFVIVQTQSRTGLAAVGAFVLALPLVALLMQFKLRSLAPLLATVVAGLLFGGLASAFIGSAPDHTADRFRSGLEGGDTSFETRLSLLEGGVATVRDDPFLGAGPDGLFLAFPKSRPANLEGEFETYDLFVQSTHNWPLDVAANLGVPGLGLLCLLVGGVAVVAIRQSRRKPAQDVLVAWAGLTAYFAITVFNPLSLAAHAIAWVVLGWLLGRAERAASPVRLPFPRATAAVGAALASSMTLLAGLMFFADLRADDAWSAFANGDPPTAARRYENAHGLLPIVRDYDARAASSWLVAGMNKDREPLERAIARYRGFDSRYGFSYDEALALATATFAISAPPADVDPLVDTATPLNPNGIRTHSYADLLKFAAREGGVLHYQRDLHWVYVEAAGLPPPVPVK